MEHVTLSFENIEKYRTFETTREMDDTIYEYIDILLKDEAAPSVIEVLRFFGRSSLRFTGVSFAKYQTIADSIGVSKRTVLRAVKTLEQYGMIEKVATVKKWRRSVNIIRIMPEMSPQNVATTESVETNGDKASMSEMEPQSTIFNHSKKNYILDTALATKNAIPAPIYNALSPFFNGADIRRLTGIILRAKRKDQRVESYSDELNMLILDVIRRFKGGLISNIDGYLYTSAQRLFRRLYWMELHTEVYGESH
ncbi:helix-turn-helix domain-containing protein [Ornithinibacillus scapharcae]|uniref:helix-turn-helix domain-containing protein n=1 Tax=Ornithinibacillus scapharcae TaxID=1147159 RepID=UPI000225B2EB|nr:helix-turn-helix domain-containing protein [Ornithinibacillus scapharcae]